MTQTIQTIYDNDNEFPWESITRTFTDRVIQTEERVMDNGIVRNSLYQHARYMDDTDVIIFLYDNEERTTRLHVDNDDNDDSHSWYLCVTEFGDTGNVITTYNSYGDVPPEYLGLIDVA